MINLSSWLVFGMRLWSGPKVQRVCFWMAYCCPLSKNDGYCSKIGGERGTVAVLPNSPKRNKSLTMKCPSNNSRNTASAVTVIPLFVGPWVCFQECNCRRSTSASQCVFHLGFLSQPHMWLKYVAQRSNRNRPVIQWGASLDPAGTCHTDTKLKSDGATCLII